MKTIKLTSPSLIYTLNIQERPSKVLEESLAVYVRCRGTKFTWNEMTRRERADVSMMLAGALCGNVPPGWHFEVLNAEEPLASGSIIAELEAKKRKERSEARTNAMGEMTFLAMEGYRELSHEEFARQMTKHRDSFKANLEP